MIWSQRVQREWNLWRLVERLIIHTQIAISQLVHLQKISKALQIKH